MVAKNYFGFNFFCIPFLPWFHKFVQSTGVLKKIIDIINACHSKAPEKRPTVTEVRLELCKILIE
jgi:hypothetical protein